MIILNDYMLSKIDELKIDLKDARNAAYLCKYNDAQKIFKKIIDSIEQQIILNNIVPKNIQTWRKFQASVIVQKNIVDNLISMLSGLNTPTYSYTRIQESPKVSNHFQEMPPHHINNNYGINRRNNSLARTNNERELQNLLSDKDPDIWDPPPPMQKRKQPIKRMGSINPQIPSNQKIDKNGKIKKKNTVDTNGKKTFLLDRYPQGSGPDTNLIEMLERQVLDSNPNITFDDIAELETAKGLLQQAVLLPLKMPQFFTGIRRAWKGVLMFGPPGTGKTLLAKAVASSGGTTFFNVSASSLASKWKGQSQKLVRILFQMAKFYSPAVIFFDQIDALGGKRKDGQDQSNRKVKTQLLVQMDGATSSENQQNKFVIVLAATNRPWDLDEALRRRLQKRIYIPLPTQKGRRQLVRINLKNVKMDQGMDLQFIVKKTQGFSGADLTNVCREAAYMPMRRKLKDEGGFKNIADMKKFQEEVNVPLKKEDFLEALKNVNKSVGKQDLKKYEIWMKEFGSV